MSKKTDYILSKIGELSKEFLSSKIELPNGQTVTFSKYCLEYLPTIMDEDLHINSADSINDIETLIMVQELDTGIDPYAKKQEKVQAKPATYSKEQVISAIKNEYRPNLGKIVDFGKSSMTLDEAISELVTHIDANGCLKVSGNSIPLPEIIDNLSEKANKTFNLIRADKIKLRTTGITCFGIDEMAISLNPDFDLENTYVRYFIETFESTLRQTFDSSQVMEISENVIEKINPKCVDVISSVEKLTNKYIQDNQILNDLMAEYGEERGVLRQ